MLTGYSDAANAAVGDMKVCCQHCGLLNGFRGLMLCIGMVETLNVRRELRGISKNSRAGRDRCPLRGHVDKSSSNKGGKASISAMRNEKHDQSKRRQDRVTTRTP